MMKLFIRTGVIYIFLVSAFFLPITGWASTAVFINKVDARFVGRTMDNPRGYGQITINPVGQEKKSLFLKDKKLSAVWKSRYGSVTLNLSQRVKPVGLLSQPGCGLNEKGLWCGAIQIQLPKALAYQSADRRPAINDWQLVEYVLDNYASVEEVVRHIGQIRIISYKEGDIQSDLYWLVADVSGDSAIIEFYDGRLKVHRHPQPPVAANNFYEDSQAFLKEFAGFGGSRPVPIGTREMTSENRYVLAAYYLKKNLDSKDPLTGPRMLGLMKHVSQGQTRSTTVAPDLTQWTAAYDLINKRIWITSRRNFLTRYVDLSGINFTGRQRQLDINLLLSGDVTKIIDTKKTSQFIIID